MSTLSSSLRAAFLRFANLFRRRNLDAQLSDELESHLRLHIEDNLRSGMSPTEARRHALLKLGGLAQTQEAYRDRQGFPKLDSLLQDLRFGARMLGKSRALTVILVLTLALGIGVNTAIFSVLNGWLLRPLPVPSPEQLTVLAFSQQKQGSNFSYPDLLDFRSQSDAFSHIFAYGLGVGALSAGGTANEFAYSSVTGDYFSALGVKPLYGRLFVPGEGEKPGEEILVVLDYSYWQKNSAATPVLWGSKS